MFLNFPPYFVFEIQDYFLYFYYCDMFIKNGEPHLWVIYSPLYINKHMQ